MKRYCFILAALLFTVVAVAQDFNQTDSKGRRQGAWRDFYPNGQVRYEGEFKNDKCKGTFRYYDEQGNLKATNEFDKSGDRALNKTYAPNGRVIATGYYLNQKKDGSGSITIPSRVSSGWWRTTKTGRWMVGLRSTIRKTAFWPRRRNSLQASPKANARNILIRVR